jgi:hypothetical protein
VGASNVPSNKRARAGWRRLAMQMVLPEGVTLTGAGRHWPRAAPEQEVARWPPAASGSSRAGPTLEDLPRRYFGVAGFFVSLPCPLVERLQPGHAVGVEENNARLAKPPTL